MTARGGEPLSIFAPTLADLTAKASRARREVHGDRTVDFRCNFWADGGSYRFDVESRIQNRTVKLESAIRILAGTMVLISISLAHWVSEWWLLLAAFVGFNLIQSAFTGYCPAETIFRKLGIGNEGGACCKPAARS